MTLLESAEDPRGRSAFFAPSKCVSQHQFKSRQRYEAIERHNTEIARAKIQNVELKLQVAHLQQQLSEWEDWWTQASCSKGAHPVTIPEYVPSGKSFDLHVAENIVETSVPDDHVSGSQAEPSISAVKTARTKRAQDTVTLGTMPLQASGVFSRLGAALLIQHFWGKRLQAKREDVCNNQAETMSNLLFGEDPITYWHVIDETLLDANYFVGVSDIDFHDSIMRALFDEPSIALSDYQANRLMAAITEPFNQMKLIVRGQQLQCSLSSMRTRGLKREHLLAKQRNQLWCRNDANQIS